jgi:hypothetical protein
MTSTRHILVAAILITMAIGLVLILVSTQTADAVDDFARSSWGHAAAILRAHIWG